MGSDKLNNWENPPASTFLLQENDEFAFTNRQNAAADSIGIFHNGSSAGADPMSFPYMPFPIAPFPWKHMNGTYQPYVHNIPESCGNLMVDLNQLQNPLIDLNSINVSSNIPSLYGQDLQCSEGNVIGVSCTRDKIGTADNFMNDLAHFSGFQNPQIDRNFTLIGGNAYGGYEMTRHSGEVYTNNIHGPQFKNFVGLEGSTTRLFDTQNCEEININNNDEVCTAQFCCPKKIDGSFLSLGIGGNTNVKSKSDLSSREITGVLNGAVSPQLNTFNFRQATGSSLNLGHNLVDGFSSFRSNVGGSTSLGHHTGGWTSSNSNVGVIKADMQRGFPISSTRNLGIVGNRDARYANLDPYKGFIGELATSSGPFSSSTGRLLDSGQTGASGLASESVKLSWTTNQPTSDQLHKRFIESPESSMVSSFIRFKGSSNRQEHSGQLFPASKYSAAQAIDEDAQPPRRKCVQPTGQLFSASDGTAPFGAGGGLFPKRIGVQAAGCGLFPPRLGVQVNEHSASQAAGDGLFSESTSVHVTDSRVAYAAECGPYPKEMGVRTASKGQVISTAKGCGLLQASNVLGRPSLKRSAIQSPPASPWVQRRKRTLEPPILPSMPCPPQTASAVLIPPIPAPVPHVKWQGSDGLPHPTGQKCMLCKRDLSFTPEGPVYQPTVPPAVAVLPCGHTFHDRCLQVITPEDQSKNPPCIPCAIGEI